MRLVIIHQDSAGKDTNQSMMPLVCQWSRQVWTQIWLLFPFQPSTQPPDQLDVEPGDQHRADSCWRTTNNHPITWTPAKQLLISVSQFKASFQNWARRCHFSGIWRGTQAVWTEPECNNRKAIIRFTWSAEWQMFGWWSLIQEIMRHTLVVFIRRIYHEIHASLSEYRQPQIWSTTTWMHQSEFQIKRN